MKKQLLVILIVSLVASVWADLPTAKEFSDTFANVVKQVNPAVVTITSTKISQRDGRRFRHPFEEFFGEDFFRDFDFPEGDSRSDILGSGVIVDGNKGYILTNNHVVDGADEIKILLIDEREFYADVIGSDSRSDLALLQIEADNLVAAQLGNSDQLDVGEWVLAIGSPFSQNLSHTVTAGIVSAKGRSQILRRFSGIEDFIQTDAAINPGNSGGALVNLDGELVGINTAIATGGFSRSNVGVGFAIPINMAKNVMTDLITEGRVIRSYLGVIIQDVDDGIAKAEGLSDREGVIVLEVKEKSPAESAGIEIEDVIRTFDGKKVRDTSHLQHLVSNTPPGKKATVEIIRDKRERTLRVELKEFPREETVLANSNENSNELGLEVETLSYSLARTYRLNGDDLSGVVVTRVNSRSAAARAGIQPGDLITRVGDNEISTEREFQRALREFDKGETILFLVSRRGGGSLFIPLEYQ